MAKHDNQKVNIGKGKEKTLVGRHTQRIEAKKAMLKKGK